MDGSGNIVWDRTYGGSGDDQAVRILALEGNGYLLGGSRKSPASSEKSQGGSDGGNLDYWIVRVDQNGKVLWDRTFDNGTEDRLSSVVSTLDGGFLIAGDTEVSGGSVNSKAKASNRDFWLVKIDGSGEMLWETTLGGEGDEEYPMVQQNEMGYLVIGTTNSGVSGDLTTERIGGRDQWVVKLNPNGTIISDGKSGKSETSSVSYRPGVESFGKNFLVTSFVDDRSADTLLGKINPEGELMREKRLGYDFLAPRIALSRDGKKSDLVQ